MVWQLAPMVTSALIGAAGSVYSSHRNKRNQEKAISRNEAREDTKIQRTVDQAKAAGIHPLAALGASPSYSSPSVVDTTGSAIGDGIARTIQAKAQKPQQDLQQQLMKAQLDEATSRTQLSRAQAFRTLNPMAIPPEISTGAWYTGKDGTRFWGPNPEAYEMSPAELAAGALTHTTFRGWSELNGGTPNGIVEKGFQALTGRSSRGEYEDPEKIIRKKTLKAYPWKHNAQNDTYKRK